MDYYSEPARTEMVSKDGFQPQYRRFSQRPPLAVGIPFPDLATVRYSRQVCRQHCGDLKPCGLSGPADAGCDRRPGRARVAGGGHATCAADSR